MAHKLDEFPVYKKAMAFWVAVTAILEKPALRRDRDLHRQIDDANNSIVANMHEGFEQSTDKAFAGFLTHSKGSLAEVLARVSQARLKGFISAQDHQEVTTAGEELGKMLGGFIKYLVRCDWKDRGRFNP